MPDEPGRRRAPGPGDVVTDPVAFVYPGQGSQRVGMWQELGTGSASGERRLAEAQDRLGLPLRQLMDEGPERALQQTEVAQPCLLLVDVVCAERLLDRGMAPVAHLGHSLGEYAALVLAGVLRFGDALQLVRERGRLMARAAERVPGGMAAVLGLEHEALEPLLTELRGDAVVEITNFNAPRQVVISGATAPVEAIVAAVNASRKGRAVMLNVSAPFHCSLMVPVAQAFRELVDAVVMRAPRQTFIDNVTGSREQDPERIRKKLVEQIYRPVRWEQALHAACRLGVRTFVECGPGGVLTGLVKRTAPNAKRLRAADLLRAG